MTENEEKLNDTAPSTIEGSISLQRLYEILTENFSEPFLVEDGVRAEILSGEDRDSVLSITIGRRDIQIDQSGEVVSSGTFSMAPKNILNFFEYVEDYEDEDPEE